MNMSWALGLVALLVLGCPAKQAAEAAPGPDTVQPFAAWWTAEAYAGQLAIERRVFELTNQERVRHGKAALTWNDALQVAARQHSWDMIQKGYFDHQAPSASERSPMQRAYLAGFWGLTGENILSWTKYQVPETEAAAREMVDDWMNSPGHRANILRDGYNQLGVGVARQGREWMATQLFGDMTFVFSEVALREGAPSTYLLTGKAQLAPGKSFSHAVVAVNGEMSTAFAIPSEKPFPFQVSIPRNGRYVVGIRPGDGSSYWIHEHFLIDGTKPLKDAFQPLEFGP